MADFECIGGTEGPISPDTFRRAVYRRAPTSFLFKVLPPEKHGNSHNYGFRIYAIKDDNASSISSGESIASVNEYDVWRKWEDCLWFQDTLEVEYSRAAREKRNRLAAGKGVKKDGVYIHSDQAASWESLPFGPNPNDIARDIHECIPRLSKKGTFFRPSQEIIDRRYAELQAMMQVLLEDDLPALIKDIKASDAFTDFFGVWRTDIDLARKAESPKKPSTVDRPRLSTSTNILSAFSVSSSIKSSSPSKGKEPERIKTLLQTLNHSDSSSSEDFADLPRQSRSMNRGQGVLSMGSRASSAGSQSSSSSPSTPVKMPQQLPPTSRQPVIASQEMPIRFGHNPHAFCSERSSPILESLPEGRELSSSPKSDLDGAWSPKQSGSRRKNRNISIYVPAPLQSSELSSRSLSRFSMSSLQSTRSSATLRATAYLDELDVDYCLPSPTPEPRHHPRASVSSLASLVTNSSVDAVIPRSERPSRSSANNAKRLPSLPGESWREQEPWSEDDSQFEGQEDILDTYFYDLIGPRPQTPDGFPETPRVDETMHRFSQKQSSMTSSSYSRYWNRRSSLTGSISSGSTSSGNSTTLSIKAIHEDNVIMLRLSRYIAFDELRRKIYEKFIQVEKSTICETFAIALLEDPPAERAESGRPRADSLASLGSGHANGVTLHFISSQDEWDDVVATHGDKFRLRIIGSRE